MASKAKKDEQSNQNDAMMELAKILCQGADTEIEPSDPVDKDGGGYEKMAMENNNELSGGAEAELLENPESVAALAAM